MRTKGEQNGRGVMIVAGLILAIGGYYSLEILWFINGSIMAPGVVVANRKSIVRTNREGDKTVIHMVVEFADAAGRKHQLEEKCISEEDGAVGTAIPVYYPPGKIAKARLGGRYLWWVPSACLCISTVLFVCGLLLVLFSRLFVWMGVPMRPATGSSASDGPHSSSP